MDRANEVLVTGATGFTGGALALELRRQSIPVRALVRNPASESALGLAKSGVALVEGDLRDAAAVDRAVAGCRLVYHIGATFRPAGISDQYYHEVNVDGVRHVLTAARKHRVGRVVHCSTVGVHGHVSRIPSDEDAPYNPGDIYQRTKLEGEKLAQAAIAEGQPVTIFRPAGIYGPGDLRFLKLFRGIQRRRFLMIGNGRTLYHFTYIDDLVAGIMLCGEHPAATGRIYILCGERHVTLNDLVRNIAEAVGVPKPRGRVPVWPVMTAAVLCEAVCRPLGIEPPLHRRRVDFFTHDRSFTNERARRELGFSPKVSLEEGIRRTAAWYFEHGHLVK
jgi:nucleoside-diphosphate-sugar epimerase